ncbi:hypothetical protein XENOCAPTIV_024623 [Xenoophorus captivus]|uniref:Uncharacterized protein n=1 Tax=Xenoophorus captivus TaxID=1517983 RepID=A0ABV0QNP9_9TELE
MMTLTVSHITPLSKPFYPTHFTHPSIFYIHFFHTGSPGSWFSSSLRARGRVHPGQVTGPSQGNIQNKQPCTHPYTPKGILERPINLTVMFLDCGRKPENTERTHTCTGRTCKLLQGSSANHCATVQPTNKTYCIFDGTTICPEYIN